MKHTEKKRNLLYLFKVLFERHAVVKTYLHAAKILTVTGFIIDNETAIPSCIGPEDGGEFALKTFLRHRKSSLLRFQNEIGEQLRCVVNIINSQRGLGGQE